MNKKYRNIIDAGEKKKTDHTHWYTILEVNETTPHRRIYSSKTSAADLVQVYIRDLTNRESTSAYSIEPPKTPASAQRSDRLIGPRAHARLSSPAPRARNIDRPLDNRHAAGARDGCVRVARCSYDSGLVRGATSCAVAGCLGMPDASALGDNRHGSYSLRV
ncbi:hypothetical protein DFH11DRAFT_1629329 [Phellopilus nigrolimitatus]|nr:hypothetical protein DFH11DRAFT_1629329 [Phellopilus nigrolimitatus]